ncbi:DUF2244 domain-containing protein [Sulfitobacter aestuarii]|uniref:DUF2244 domain-containing protein n=1 Tax=Sulfitobacter aestuarii TaxID=2161676 RepID=A0ABW5TXZ3_9RHOB
MPYHWITPPRAARQEMRLWPHQSLPPRGFAGFILATFILILIPVLALLGTVLLWGLLPFVLMAVGGIYYALRRNRHARQIEEILTLDADQARLSQRAPDGSLKTWQCNRYWVTVHKYEEDGPVPHYVTLRGEGREVEIGAFLSEEERIALFEDLQRHLRP